jgi:hypothetical protein
MDAALMRGLRLLLLAAAAGVAGCMPPVMQPWAGLSYGSFAGRGPPVYADALLPLGGSLESAVMIDVSIWLDAAPAFTLVFPDGFAVSSRAVSAAVLQAHGASLGKPSRINAKQRLTQQWESSDGVTVIFELQGDRATQLRFCSPTHMAASSAGRLSFVAADGVPVALPLSHAGLNRLFGPHQSVTRDFLLAKFSC